ncbi:MAG: N-acetyltransferase [Lachnospiraceae bacterium]|nr:N-acetyltransferase [Lachnospiraceae bacterium]
MKEGFELIGFDSCCYSNKDIDKREVRLDLGYFPRKTNVRKEDIIIRKEKEDEYHKVEEITLRSFWNKHHLGCNEHLLVHKMRNNGAYLPKLSRVAEVEGEIAGVICYARAMLQNGDDHKEILTFGPLCVAPEWQGCGVGGVLLEETLKLAKNEGFEGIVIFGDPDYYPLHGFKTCDKFGITTIDGKNFDAFMGIELVEGALTSFGGKFIEPEVFEDLPEEENEELTRQFDAPVKRKFPGQWD